MDSKQPNKEKEYEEACEFVDVEIVRAEGLGRAVEVLKYERDKLWQQPKVIYTVCTIGRLGNKLMPKDCKDTKEYLSKREHKRTPGFFFKLEDAIECVEKNWGDIYEYGYYPHVVIEAMPEGLYCIDIDLDKREIWYQWEGDEKTGKYVRIEKKKLKEIDKDIMTTCNWGIG